MSAHISNVRPGPDKVIVDIVDYVQKYKVSSKEAYDTARYCLLDTLGCGFEALAYPACRKLLGPVVQAMHTLIRQVEVSEPATRLVLRLVRATHPDASEAPEIVQKYVKHGASVRAAQAMILAAKALALLDGRYHAAVDDVRSVALPALNHRIIRNFHGEMERVTTEGIVEAVLAASDR